MPTIQLDTAIIGGGCSGAYSAWRLQQAFGKKQKIALFEYSNRIGGRLYTVNMPGMPNVKAEVGGMRYIPTQHILVADLITHLGLETKPFPMGAPEPVGSNCNLFYLRGKHLRLHELADPDKVPYNLAWSERGLGPTNLQVQVMNYLFPNMQNLSLCDLMKVKVFGKELWKYGFWDLMFRVLSNEGYQFMRDAGGYDANVANANAVTQLPATEYSDSTQFLTLKDGYDQLPIKMVDEFNNLFPGVIPLGERVYMNHRLAEILPGDSEGYKYKLVFERTVTSERNKTTVSRGAENVIVYANKIVLGMPRRSLELIKGEFFEDSWLKENLGSVLIQSAFKLFLAYERPWWRTFGLVAGRSVTDLPVRQVYYFGTESEQPGGKPWLNSLLMASYNDISTVPFWKGLEAGEAFKGYRPSCFEGDGPVIPPMEHEATDEMVNIANKQLAEIHAVPEIPKPYSAVYHDWSGDPYGGGWHEWKANYRLDEIMWRMLKPVEKDDIFIVGEAYSIGQGWVEGALDTAEQMLESYFGLERPHWLDPNYALMPVPEGGCGDVNNSCVPATEMGATLDSMTPNCLQKIQEG